MKIIERIQNIVTAEITDIERDMTLSELESHNATKQKLEAKAELDAEVATKKNALWAKLGITADEAKLLLS